MRTEKNSDTLRVAFMEREKRAFAHTIQEIETQVSPKERDGCIKAVTKVHEQVCRDLMEEK